MRRAHGFLIPLGALLLVGCGTIEITVQGRINGRSASPSASSKSTTTNLAPSASSTAGAPTHTPNSGLAQLKGTIKNGQLQAVVWVSVSPTSQRYPVTLMLDTGAEHTMVSGYFFKSAGDTPTGQTTTYAGIGGNERVGFWPNVWVFPQNQAKNPVIAGQTEPGGLNRTALGSESVIILLGQDVIQTGKLTQNGTRWTFTYRPQ